MTLIARLIFFCLTGISIVSFAGAHELTGEVSIEYRHFFNDPVFPEQSKNGGSLALKPEYYHVWEKDQSFTFIPFARLDSADSKRTHFDIRELIFLWPESSWEFEIGIGKVFWGVTEFVHLVDIINQTDLVESIDGEEKLGQPMAHLTTIREWGILDFFLLPWFRERTFPGPEGRLRPAIPIDQDHSEYESSAEENHMDLAVRYSHSLLSCDFGLYYFIGTGREPSYILESDKTGNPVLVPFYQQITQTGLDMQLIFGEWLCKLEAIYRTGQEKDYYSFVGGFEYTLVGVGDTAIDIGIIGEYAYDDRGTNASSPFENDMLMGLRFNFNDMQGSEILTGISFDTRGNSNVLSIEGNRRLTDRLKIHMESYLFFDVSENDYFYDFRDDDYIQIGLTYHF